MPSSLNSSGRALCQLTLHSRVRCHVQQDMGVATCGNLVPVPLETRGRVSHLDGNPFNQWSTAESTISSFSKVTKKNSRDRRSQVCVSLLWGPTLSTWDILDLEITPLTHPFHGMLPPLPVENNRTEFLYAPLRFSVE